VEIAAARTKAGNVMIKLEIFIKEKCDLKEVAWNRPIEE
jgi:hypothetical protein